MKDILRNAATTLLTLTFGLMLVLVLGAWWAPAPADAATPELTHRHIAACPNDEAAEAQPVLPCAWDARHQGNGLGHSLLIRRDGSLLVISHERAHRLTH